MATEVWFRNPHDYIRELVECAETNIAWDRGLLVKRRIDPIKHAQLYIGKSLPYRILCVGPQGTAEYRPGDELDKPSAVYPTWSYGEDSIILEEMLSHPLGEDEDSINDESLPGDERPIRDQEHRVVITDVPDTRAGSGRQFLRYLKSLQEDFPNAIIHLHGTYGWKVAFGMGWGAADVEPRTSAQKGKVHLPSGAVEKYERLVQKPQWCEALGFKPNDLAVPRNRCMYNIKSAVWAGLNYEELYKFKVRSGAEVDYLSSDKDHVPQETKSIFSGPVKKAPGDQLICDTCTLQSKCKYFRVGSVCTVPGADPVPLARMFGTRDADDIIDGLGIVMAAGANRLEKAVRWEEIDGEMSPEVTKMMGQIFDQGTKLAKLLDPKRFSPGAKVNVNVGNGAPSLSTGDPRQIVAAAVRELRNQGIAVEDITPEAILGVMTGMNSPEAAQKAVHGEIEARREESA